MTARRIAFALLLCSAMGFGETAGASEIDGSAPEVVVSLKPIHSLVAGVMAGLGEPRLLIKGSASPHAYSLKPSDARALSEADVVFWIGDGMETALERPLQTLAGDAQVVALSSTAGITLLESREGGAWETHSGHGETEEEHLEHHEAGEAHSSGQYNLHIWLDPDNAIAIVKAAVSALAMHDPGHAADYARNGDRLVAQIRALDQDLRGALAPVKDAPFVVFHDAYHYFEEHYGLNAVGSLTVSPDRAPGAQRVSEIRRKIRGLGAACVFSEPQFAPSVVDTVIAGTPARRGVLDPLGASHPAGPEAYALLMRGITQNLRKCLAVAS